MKNNKISNIGISSLIISLCNSAFYGTLSSFILFKTKTDSFISIIIGFIISLLLSKIIFKLFNKYPSKTFTQRGNVHKITSAIFIILSMFTYTLLSYRLSTFLSNQYLINTPNFVIYFMIIISTYYTSSKGIETIIRVSIITIIISLFIFVFDFISLIPQINFDNFYPMIISNPKDILLTSIIFSIYFITPTIFINTIKKDQINNYRSFNKYFYSSLFISFVIILINIFTTIGVSGINVNNLFDYPVYTTLKRIHLFSFLDSMENISIMLWMLFIINTSNLNLIFVNNLLKESFNKNNKIVNIIIVFVCFITPIIFFKDGFIESYDYIVIPTIISSLLILLLLFTNIKDRLSK